MYIITGKKRKELKKQLNNMKHLQKMFYYFNDINIVYGGGITDEEEINKILLMKQKEINKMESLLNETI